MGREVFLLAGLMAVATPASAKEIPGTEENAPRAEDIVVPEDPEAVFRAFSVLADDAKAERYARGIAGVAAGGVTLGIGAYLKSEDRSRIEPWMVAGGLTVGLSALSLWSPSVPEQVAARGDAKKGSHALADALVFEQEWKLLAAWERRQRNLSGIFGLVTSGLLLGSGIAVARGAYFDSPDERLPWSIFLIGAGAASVVPAASQFFLRGPIESAYEAYKGAQPSEARPGGVPRLQISWGASPQGASLVAGGVF